MNRLEEILETMKIPPIRLQDWEWLNKNLGIENHSHPNFFEAAVLVKEKLRRERAKYEF